MAAQSHPLTRVLLLVLLAGLLAAPLVLKGTSSARQQAASEGAAERYGLALTEVSDQAGLDFTHIAPGLDSKLEHIMPQVAATGAAVSIADFDRDGWQDLYVCNSGEGTLNSLYRNNGDGTFTDVAERMGVARLNEPGTGCSMGSIWADYDNDGYEDLLVYRWGAQELFRNESGRGFTRVTDGAGLPKWINAGSACWLDYDRDGYVDLFIAGYFADHLNLWRLDSTRMMPESFEYATNGGRKYLLRNNGGDGTFTDVTKDVGIDSTRWALAVSSADINFDGWPDVFASNDYGVSELYINREGKRFDEVGESSNVGISPKSGMNASFGDVFNNGLLAIYKTNISEEGVLVQGNDLWVASHVAPESVPQFANLSREMGVELGGWSWGAQFGDLNNDGWLDLYLTNGYVSAERDTSYWYDFSKVAGGNTAIISDAANWPDMKGRSLSGYQQKKVWLNDGAGRFVEVAQAIGATDTYDGRAVALGDLFNNGALDVVVANQRGPLLLYKNQVTPENGWVAFELEGTKSNRSAIGAQVKLYFNGLQQLQEVSGGSGFCAQNQRRLHFGLGNKPAVERVEIRWPSGTVQTIDAAQIKLGQVNEIKEPA